MDVPIVKKSVWDSRADVVVITSNGTINNYENKLRMDRGSAFEASRMFPWLPNVAANLIREASIGFLEKKAVYGFVCAERDGKRIGILQTKLDWDKPASIALIGFSCIQMMIWLNDQQRRIKTVALNFPGQGLIGGLTPEEVLPVVGSIVDQRVKLYLGSVLGE